MTSQILKRVTDSQPAIIMATALAACISHGWPTVVAVFVILQVGIVLATLGTRRLPLQHTGGMRFLARACAIPQTAAPPSLRPRRVRLRLVP